VAHKSQLSVVARFFLAVLGVESVAATDKRLFVPPVAVEAIDGDLVGLSINSAALVQSLLGDAEEAVGHA
jgi:hypothetical protein